MPRRLAPEEVARRKAVADQRRQKAEERKRQRREAYDRNHCACGRVLGSLNRAKGLKTCDYCRASAETRKTWDFLNEWMR